MTIMSRCCATVFLGRGVSGLIWARVVALSRWRWPISSAMAVRSMPWDRDGGVLREQARAMAQRFPAVAVRYITADFTRSFALPLLDGIVMANSLHFVRDKPPVLQRVRGYLKPGGRLLLVEYNADSGNMWVPYPLSYPTWEALARQSGFTTTRQLATWPSRFLREIYSAMSQ